MSSSKLQGIGAVLVASILWGTTGTAATFAPDVGPLAIGAAALGIGGILQALIALPALKRARLHLKSHGGLVITGAVAVFAYPLAFYSSMHLAGVAVGTVISLASAPLASGLLERFVDRKALGGWWYVAALLGIIGSVLLVVSTQHDQSDGGPSMIIGIILGLVAGVAYATYSWVVQRLMAEGVTRAASMGSVFGLGGLLLIPVLITTGAPLLATPQAFAVGSYMALVPMFLGYVAFGFGLSKIPASSATTVTLTEPAVATVLAVVIVGEQLAPLGWLGLVVFGVVLLILALAPQRASNTSIQQAALLRRRALIECSRIDRSKSWGARMWKRWLLLLGAIVAEVLGTMSLRAAVETPWFSVGVVVGYVVAFTLLGLALGQGIPVGIAYGIWAAAGVALVAVLGAVIFGETLSFTSILGLVTIIVGVFIVQTGQRDTAKAEVLQA